MKRISLLLVPLLLASCAAPPSSAPRRAAAELAGRKAGAPQHCISFDRLEGLRVSDTDRHMLLYGRGGMIWANDLGPECGFSVNDSLISEPLSRYCRGDLVRSLDHVSQIPGPTCVLGDFVPYKR